MPQGPTKNLEMQMPRAARVPVDVEGPLKEVSASLVPVVPVDFAMSVAAPMTEVPAHPVGIAVVVLRMVWCWSSKRWASVIGALVGEVEREEQVVAAVQVFDPLEIIHSSEAAAGAAAVVVHLIRPLVAQQPR